jgi:hypothetical protein
MLSPLVSTAFFSASGLKARKLLGAARVDPLLHREADARLGLGVAFDRSAICISVRALSRYICAA